MLSLPKSKNRISVMVETEWCPICNAYTLHYDDECLECGEDEKEEDEEIIHDEILAIPSKDIM